MPSSPLKLLPQVTCPHCWERFVPEQVLWVSEHVDLLGDPFLGPEQQQRFLPSRFTPEGDALDARGLCCRHLACPKCHLNLPRSLLEHEPLFVSILGAPASGKSYFLTAMAWQLRTVLPQQFGIAFHDADPVSNRTLNTCEELLFLNPDADRLTPLSDLIRKTELQGELYDTVAFGQQHVSYPRPFLFTLRPQAEHPNGQSAGRLSRTLCLYDNAGEHFQPGLDSTSSPVTRHLARSRALLFLFDPTQDPRFRAAYGRGQSASAMPRGRVGRQETLIHEARERIQRHAGLSSQGRFDRPLVVVLTKFDAWSSLLPAFDGRDPWRAHRSEQVCALEVERIEYISGLIRTLLLRLCPETVAAADALSKDVTFMASSSLGDRVETDPQSGALGIRPGKVQPVWVAAPLLHALSKVLPGLVPRLVRKKTEGAQHARPASEQGDQ